jgi:hypothetical protein
LLRWKERGVVAPLGGIERRGGDGEQESLDANARNVKYWSVRARSIGMGALELTIERAALMDGSLSNVADL